MEVPAMIAGLTDAGERLAHAARRAGLGATVPSCPDWTVRDLLFHTSAVHRWAARYVNEGLDAPIREQRGGDPVRDAEHRPADDKLLEFFRQGYTALAAALKEAPDASGAGRSCPRRRHWRSGRAASSMKRPSTASTPNSPRVRRP